MDVQILCNITINLVKKPNYYSIVEETIYCFLKCYCIIYKHVKNTKNHNDIFYATAVDSESPLKHGLSGIFIEYRYDFLTIKIIFYCVSSKPHTEHCLANEYFINPAHGW